MVLEQELSSRPSEPKILRLVMMTLNFLTPGHHTMKKSRGQKGNNVYNTRVAKTENFIFAATIFEKKYDLSILRFEFSVLLN